MPLWNWVFPERSENCSEYETINDDDDEDDDDVDGDDDDGDDSLQSRKKTDNFDLKGSSTACMPQLSINSTSQYHQLINSTSQENILWVPSISVVRFKNFKY